MNMETEGTQGDLLEGAESTEETQSDEPVETEEGAGEPEGESKSQSDPRDEQIKLLMEQNRQMMEMMQGRAQPAEKPVEEKVEIPQFVTAELQKRIFEDQDPAALNEAIAAAAAYAVAHVGKKLPEVVEGSVRRQVSQNSVIERFYRDNEDLVPHKNHVAIVAQELAAENPRWSPDKLLEETGKTFRKRFGLVKKVEREPKKAPGVAGGKAGGAPAKKAAPKVGDNEQKQKALIDDMFDAV